MSSPSILFINQYYYPDHAATAQYLADLAEYLADGGFDVHVLCSRGKYTSGRMDVPRREVHNGVHIHRVNSTAFSRSSHLRRLLNYASFSARAFYRMVTGPKYDCVITLTTPPLLGVLGAFLQKLRGQRYGIWSMDLHPEAERAAGLLQDEQFVTRAVGAFDTLAVDNAEFMVDLGRCMKERLLEKNLGERKLQTVPVWSRKDEVYPVPDTENPLVEKIGVKDKFVVMYSGNAGLAHRFSDVLEVVRRLKDHPEIYFLFVGSGLRREEIERFVERHSIPNFQYLDYYPREQIKYSLSLADVQLVTLKEEFVGIAVPSKLYGIMAAARPAVMVGPETSEISLTIEEHDCGIVVEPSGHNGRAPSRRLEETILHLYENGRKRRRLGENGREAFLKYYEKDIACERWEELLRGVIDRTEPARE